MRARHYTLVSFGLLLFAAATATTCGPSPRDQGDNCTSVCTALGYQKCHEDGTFDPPIACGPDEICDPTHGCIVCIPDQLYCAGPLGNDVYRCNGEGTDGDLVESCPADAVCSEGQCKTPCEASEDHPSNLGCDFWAADLDNEAFNIAGASNDAAAQQFAVVAANNNDYPVTVTVTKNAARVGQPVNEQVVATVTIPARVAQRIDLPQREVDGSMGQNGSYTRNSGSGTFVSPHAYHIVSSAPVVVYQFNPIIQQFSNDASTLIPIAALGTDYIAVGYETANPCGITGMTVESIPDHGSIAIIAPFDDTEVTITASHPLMASGGDSGVAIPATPKGGTTTFTMGRYTVVNLETAQMMGSVFDCASAANSGQTGDVTGTYIKATKPVVVFTASERGAGFGGADNVVYPPDWDMASDDTCCTDHLEEQLFPVTALGREFAVARSPIRSTDPSGWIEPDIVRVVGSADNTLVQTSLPPPYNQFTINAREKKTFAATTGFTISADKAIQVSSYLVSQHFVKHGQIGDPSQLLIAPAEQHRKDYVFLVPATFTQNYGVFAKPVAAQVKLDGVPLDSIELSQCKKAPIGTVAGIDYEQVTCPLTEGRHQVAADLPFGLSVYGYYNVGSYAFVGGSDVKLINPIE
ncbi:MAG TPA: IgGFc-binding protein [Kofleriaceae bacterium]|nr:IgGFc-binding protein [Kofleriaceae bacterium]